MTETPTRYRFGPLERRGLIAGWRGGQILLVAGGLVVGVFALRAAPNAIGILVGVIAIIVAVFVACWPIAGRTGEEWLPVVVRWTIRGRRDGRRRMSRLPARGLLGVLDDAPPMITGAFHGSRRRDRESSTFEGVEVRGVTREQAHHVGLVCDRRIGSHVAVVRLRGHSFALLGNSEKERRVSGWASVLSGFAREGSVIQRVQWLATTTADHGDGIARFLAENAALHESSPARRSYEDLLATEGAHASRHDVLLAIEVHTRGLASRAVRAAGGGDSAASAVLLREMGNLEHHLKDAEVDIDGLLDPSELSLVLQRREAVPASRHSNGGVVASPFPMAMQAEWDCLHVDDEWCATYWVSEWPRLEVGADFLGPLLLGAASRTLSVVMEPISPSVAARLVAQERTADVANAELRRRGGFLATARQSREADVVSQRESELADGHAAFRLSGYVSVFAPTRELLIAACEETEQAAGHARLELRRLFGDQERAYAYTLPMCRGLGLAVTLRGLITGNDGVRSSNLPSHQVTSRNLGAAYPLVAESGLGHRGVLIGKDLLGGSFVYDPFELYQQGVLSNPNMVVFGQIGRGKSSFVKSYLWRQGVFGRRAWVVDPKGEYRELARAWGVTPVALRPGGSIRLNPLDGPSERRDFQNDSIRRRSALLGSLAVACLGRDLSPRERVAIDLALASLSSDSSPTLPLVVDALLAPSLDAARSIRTSPEILLEDGRDVALELRRLVCGDLRGMFDGPTTPGLNLSGPLVVLDLSALYNSQALGVLMACATAWLQATLAHDETVARSSNQVLVVVDEAWAILANLGVARWLQSSWKLSRAHGVANMAILHRLSDLHAVGAADSEQVGLAEGLLSDSETRVVYAQSPGEVASARDLLSISDTEAELLPNLRQGVALWKIGSRSFLVQHRLSGYEYRLVDTDAAMGQRRR